MHRVILAITLCLGGCATADQGAILDWGAVGAIDGCGLCRQVDKVEVVGDVQRGGIMRGHVSAITLARGNKASPLAFLLTRRPVTGRVGAALNDLVTALFKFMQR